ncbi:hypothetical protein [Burkholderia sp. BCC1970]|uniref:hypothetical protein n=1 Tax=Burkholderia sp. BCC1970 TaxID=2817437 RepID=UPI002ABDE72A|nr:hypothetical protein [Burkholderia sp. BCC1970]
MTLSYIAPRAMKLGPRYIAFGAILAAAHLFVIHHFKQVNSIMDALVRRMDLNVLLAVCATLLIAKIYVELQRRRSRASTSLETVIDIIEGRAVSAAIKAGATIIGVAAIALASGSYYAAWIFAICGCYLTSLAELLANPIDPTDQSRLCRMAFAVVVSVPFAL